MALEEPISRQILIAGQDLATMSLHELHQVAAVRLQHRKRWRPLRYPLAHAV